MLSNNRSLAGIMQTALSNASDMCTYLIRDEFMPYFSVYLKKRTNKWTDAM